MLLDALNPQMLLSGEEKKYLNTELEKIKQKFCMPKVLGLLTHFRIQKSSQLFRITQP